MVQCERCNRWLHAECDGIDSDKYDLMALVPQDLPYFCPDCRCVLLGVAWGYSGTDGCVRAYRHGETHDSLHGRLMLVRQDCTLLPPTLFNS